MEILTTKELKKIQKEIDFIYDDIVGRYDDTKYPEKVYQDIVAAFSKKTPENGHIENAMKWKWGHWGKNNYPQRHKDLIDKIKQEWSSYIKANCHEACETFYFWSNKLGKPRQRYITVAFITHLIHPDSVPIIDQHNYRAMLHLLRVAGRNPRNKKKPSNWEDIMNMEMFLSMLSYQLKKQKRDVDKFLMMYGRHCVPR
jgi:hypothetical protein